MVPFSMSSTYINIFKTNKNQFPCAKTQGNFSVLQLWATTIRSAIFLTGSTLRSKQQINISGTK